MYLAELTASLRRRWYLVVVGLVLTAVGGLAMTRLVAPNYEMQASVLLIPPANTTTATGNPFLFLGGLSQAMDVLVTAMNADASRKPIQDAFPTVAVTNERDGTTSGPIMIISAVGPDSEVTTNALSAVLDSVPQELTNLQQPLAVPAGATISSMVLAADTAPTMDRKAQTRAMVSVVAVGLVATVLLTGFIDKVVTNRRSTRLSGSATTDGDDDPTAPCITRTITVPALVSGSTTRDDELHALDATAVIDARDEAPNDQSAMDSERRRGRHSVARADASRSGSSTRVRG